MDATNIFIVGIKGAAMCHIAVILKKMGKQVGGCDVADQFITDEVLTQNGIVPDIGFDTKNLTSQVDLVVYSAAHGGTDNPVVVAAKNTGVAVMSQAELLGELLTQFNITIAVCGTHGKTTTTSLLTYAFMKLGSSPSYLIGSSNFTADGKTYPGGDYQGRDYFVIEADEYGVNPPLDKTPKFQLLKPTHIIALNVDFDHPDVYANLEEVKQAFTTFFEEGKAKITYCADDAVLADVATSLPALTTTSFGLSEQSKYRISNIRVEETHTLFSLTSYDESITDIALSLYGEKNVSNAAGVIVCLLDLGFTPDEIKRAIAGFTGPKRRLELKFENKDTYLFDDYAHHPAEIEATIAALRARFPGHRLVTIFQPHTFSRTATLVNEFSKALSGSDLVYVMPIFASAREATGNQTVSSGDIVSKLTDQVIGHSIANQAQLSTSLKADIHAKDIVVTMGAGDVYKLSDAIIELIKAV